MVVSSALILNCSEYLISLCKAFCLSCSKYSKCIEQEGILVEYLLAAQEKFEHVQKGVIFEWLGQS